MNLGPFAPNSYVVGDCRALLAQLPDESIDCVVTSPPYYGLRSYLDKDDPWKPLELGQERTPAEYVAALVEVFREIKRVLRADGTCWIVLGDSFAGSWGARGRGEQTNAPRGDLEEKHGTECPARKGFPEMGIKPKDLMLIPARVAIALQGDGWWIRSEVIWEKPNVLPSSAEDRPTLSHEHLYLLTKSATYFYDIDSIREPHAADSIARVGRGRSDDHKWADGGPGNQTLAKDISKACHPNGRNKRTVWRIPTEPSSEEHFAQMPRKLVEPCILAGCRPGGICLDPFGGSGTTARVAEDLGRKWLLFDLSAKYAEIAKRKTAQTGLLGRITP